MYLVKLNSTLQIKIYIWYLCARGRGVVSERMSYNKAFFSMGYGFSYKTPFLKTHLKSTTL